MRTSLVIGNWKMNGSLASNTALANALSTADLPTNMQVAVCPPALHLAAVSNALAGTAIEFGAQNVSQYADGAVTGEISTQMLVDMGAKWVLVGHSERRAQQGETNQIAADKVRAALDAGLIPVLCVGETDEQRMAGDTLSVIEQQLAPVVALGDAFGKAVVAYEPVWAIGTGKTATAEQAQAVHKHIRSIVGEQTQILYGGSVKATNATELFAMADIDGGLIGGAALNADDFAAICKAVR